MKKKWFEKYFPFVVRSPVMQLEWLVAVFKKGVLSGQEIAPYIRLFLSEDGEEKEGVLKDLFGQLDERIIEQMLMAAEIYDIPKLFQLIRQPTVRQAVIALRKTSPPYEKKPELLFDKVFQVIHLSSAEMLEKAAAILHESEDAPDHFEPAHARFQEIIEDEKLLSSLYPKATYVFRH